MQTDKAPEDLEEAQLRVITRFACVSAGLSTTRPGGISSVPEMHEINIHLKSDYPAYQRFWGHSPCVDQGRRGVVDPGTDRMEMR